MLMTRPVTNIKTYDQHLGSPPSVTNVDVIEEFILFLGTLKTRTRLRTQYQQKLSYIEYNLGEMKIRIDWIEIIILCILIVTVCLIFIFIFLRWRKQSSQRDEILDKLQRSSNTEMMSLQYYRPGQGIKNDFDEVLFLFKGYLNTDFRFDIR